MTFLCGMSFGFWRSRHNRHHAHCQEVGRRSGHALRRVVLRLPELGELAHARRPLLPAHPEVGVLAAGVVLLGRAPLRRDPRSLPASDKTKVDRFLLPLHWIVLLVVPGFVWSWPAAILAYVTVSCLSSLMTASVFIPNHMGMRRLDHGRKLSYLERQVTTSRNISNPRLLDFYFGGLNSQIEHHLFPRVPHHRYRAMRPIVRAFCRERGLAYEEASFERALAAVGHHLGAMTAAHAASRRARPLTSRSRAKRGSAAT